MAMSAALERPTTSDAEILDQRRRYTQLAREHEAYVLAGDTVSAWAINDDVQAARDQLLEAEPDGVAGACVLAKLLVEDVGGLDDAIGGCAFRLARTLERLSSLPHDDRIEGFSPEAELVS